MSKGLPKEVLEAAYEAGAEFADDQVLDALLSRNAGSRNIVASDSDASVSLYSAIDAEYRSHFRK